LNHSFLINEKWAIGWHNDMKIIPYIVDEGHAAQIAREYPLITSLVGVFKPENQWGFLLEVVGNLKSSGACGYSGQALKWNLRSMDTEIFLRP
jgi:hypothetical protein